MKQSSVFFYFKTFSLKCYKWFNTCYVTNKYRLSKYIEHKVNVSLYIYFDQVRHLLQIIYITILMKFPRTAIHDDFYHFNIPHSRRSLPSFRDKLATLAHSIPLSAILGKYQISKLVGARQTAILLYFSAALLACMSENDTTRNSHWDNDTDRRVRGLYVHISRERDRGREEKRKRKRCEIEKFHARFRCMFFFFFFFKWNVHTRSCITPHSSARSEHAPIEIWRL